MFEHYYDSFRQTKLRAILRDFFVVFQTEVKELLDAEVYELNQEETFNRFWIKKGRVYEDEFTYQDLENTYLEQVLLSKEEQTFTKMNTFIDPKTKKEKAASVVYAKPVFSGLKLTFVILLYLEDTPKSLDALNYLELKLIGYQATKEQFEENQFIKQVLAAEGIRAFHKRDLMPEVKKLFQDVLAGEERTLKQQNKFHQLFAIDEHRGYTVDVTDKLELELKEQLAYMDPSTKLFGLKKMLEETDHKTVIKLQFSDGYLVDVINRLQSTYTLYQAKNGLYLKLDTVDKRSINSIIKDLTNKVRTIPTLDLSIGVLRIPTDTSIFDESLLDIIVNSKELYYNKSYHIEKTSTIQKKRFLYNALVTGSYEVNVYPIRSLGNQMIGLFYPSIETFDDLRMELLYVQHMLKLFAKDKGTSKLFLEVTDDLLMRYDLVTYLKEHYANNHFLKRLTFLFEEKHQSFEQYLREKHVTIGRRNFEAVVKQELETDYLFLKLPYHKQSNHLMDLLSKFQSSGILTPIFQVEDIEDYYYLVENQIGYMYELKE